MTDYFVDDGGDNSDGLTWAKAFSSTYAMLNHGVNPRGTAGAPFASGDKCYFGNDTVDAASYSANTTIVGPTSGLPAVLISSTVGSGTTVSYSKSSTRQIDTSNNGANTHTIHFDGSFALYGMLIKSGGAVSTYPDFNESFFADDCTFSPGANAALTLTVDSSGVIYMRDIMIDCAADGTTARETEPLALGTGMSSIIIDGIVFTNVAYRTDVIFDTPSSANRVASIAGVDCSGATNGTDCEIVTGGFSGKLTLTNVLTKASFTMFSSSAASANTDVMCTNIGPADAPTYLAARTYFGDVLSTSSIYRTGGATVEGDACAWLITTTATCGEGAPFYSPWIYGTVSSTGSKTFTCYITNDTADFTDAQVWLEVEYLSTADEAIWALATDQRATITTTAAAQTDDTTSSWNGTGPSFTYKQSLAVTATVNETGQFRARVAVGVASIAGSRYFYVDPKVTVS